MPQQDAAARFEAALIDTVSKLSTYEVEPALAPFVVLLHLLDRAADADEHTAKAAESILKDLRRAYAWVRTHDKNWPEWLALTKEGQPVDTRTGEAPPPKPIWQPKRVHVLRSEHLPPDLSHVHDLVTLLWPVLPLIQFLHDARASNAWKPEEITARVWEHAFVALCTKPKKMFPCIYDLARTIVRRMRRIFPRLEQDEIDSIADDVACSFQRRNGSVSRYKARARTIPEAAKGVRRYMEAAIRLRAKDAIRTHLDPSFAVPASTLRRWRRKLGIVPENPVHAEEVRRDMKSRQTHAPPDRVSIAKAAKMFGRARSTTMNALHVAEKKYNFTADRGPDRTTIWLTHEQVRWLRECLPAPRRRQPPAR
ncbi:hypothetical protein [Polyangium spumosum]|uniref:Uncharacterized protein n=1 Tax=Polyangium spumosum TaxID=889282 RepID=A0A6N7PX02_9BACT|nr:hypothetical protein [Polyangium spumosum]MRG96523.1 hypothetical protein [Polyangium spumosum]